MPASATQQIVSVFTTVFLLIILGFAIQKLRPLYPQTLTQISNLIVEVLLPFFLFFSTATASIDSLGQTPLFIVAAMLITLSAYALAWLVQKPFRVQSEQKSAFEFSAMQNNASFLGLPICVGLFGQVGAVYAVLFEFGKSLVVLTFGIWVLSGRRLNNWRPFIINPLIWSIILGLAWNVLGLPFPGWLVTPSETLGQATLPLALIVTGAQIGNLPLLNPAWKLQLSGLTLTRLILTPVLVALVFAAIGWTGVGSKVFVVQAGLPVGATAAIYAETYRADAEFAATAIMWTTIALGVSLPLLIFTFNLV